MKKVLSLLICLFMLVSVTGCALTKEGEVTTAPKPEVKEEQEVVEDTMVEEKVEIFNEKEYEKTFTWDQVIECDQSSSGSYINYYLVNYKTVKTIYFKNYSNLIKDDNYIEELEKQKSNFEGQGFKDVKIYDKAIVLNITSDDILWNQYSGGANDVYMRYENDMMEQGVICATRDNK